MLIRGRQEPQLNLIATNHKFTIPSPATHQTRIVLTISKQTPANTNAIKLLERLDQQIHYQRRRRTDSSKVLVLLRMCHDSPHEHPKWRRKGRQSFGVSRDVGARLGLRLCTVQRQPPTCTYTSMHVTCTVANMPLEQPKTQIIPK